MLVAAYRTIHIQCVCSEIGMMRLRVGAARRDGRDGEASEVMGRRRHVVPMPFDTLSQM